MKPFYVYILVAQTVELSPGKYDTEILGVFFTPAKARAAKERMVDQGSINADDLEIIQWRVE